MSEPYLGEIQVFAFYFPPAGWAYCNGAVMSTEQNAALFTLIGVRFGGDGTNTFQLPNLAGRMAGGAGGGPGLSARAVGQAYGVDNVSLSGAEMPAHGHALTALLGRGASRAARPVATGGLGAYVGATAYATELSPSTVMDERAIGVIGSGTPHANVQPVLAMNPCISLGGIYPSFD